MAYLDRRRWYELPVPRRPRRNAAPADRADPVNRTQGSAVTSEEAVAAAGSWQPRPPASFSSPARWSIRLRASRAGMPGRWSRGAGSGLACPGTRRSADGDQAAAARRGPWPGGFPGWGPDPGQNQNQN